MTASDITLLKAEIALLRSVSPTKGPAQRYGEAAIRNVIADAGERLAASTFRNPVTRRS
ncbi:hypothetical protein MKK69_09230 [Methylobacterium sp. J-026]|jgi:hypothetical protein|uniref:Uncharacterized protein n=1 Tax=Methylobacterium cerastii TaxID=932741 RepID=A0ABQ4QKW4_9HYPH|nr:MULTISPECIES: hypothetical protein [Methylobacterium]MCJ2134234.1 hypothetical protein [Methylobacterium sp. J-026]GJD45833.1 hypothetical protein AFCDBAGC_3710 [Methylobacterium cerastii]